MSLLLLGLIQISLVALAVSVLPDFPDNDLDPQDVEEAVCRALVLMMH